MECGLRTSCAGLQMSSSNLMTSATKSLFLSLRGQLRNNPGTYGAFEGVRAFGRQRVWGLTSSLQKHGGHLHQIMVPKRLDLDRDVREAQAAVPGLIVQEWMEKRLP
jgi:hypothetical protein